MTENESIGHYGVSVGQVLALVPYVAVVEQQEPLPAPHPYGPGGVTERMITRQEVTGFIESVTARVRGHAAAGDRFGPGHWVTDYLATAGADAVKNGAASYTLAAVSPEGAAGGTGQSYAAVLWERFKEALDEIDQAIDRAKESPGPLPAGPSGAAGIRTRPARFPDWGAY